MTARVSISIVNRSYEIACDEGQEQDVLQLAAEVDRRATELLGRVGQVGDARLLAMVAMVMVDEIREMGRGKGAAGADPDLGQKLVEGLDQKLAEGIDLMTRKIEILAEKLAEPSPAESE